MKSLLTFALCLAVFCLMSLTSSLQAEDWKTTDGKVYQNVSVVKAEPDAVTILHQTGGALVPLTSLSPELQKRFNYDPVAAKTAAVARIQADAENGKVLQAEMNQARQVHQAELIAEDPRTPASDVSSSAGGVADDSSLTSGPVGYIHHSMSDLVDITKRLRDDHPNPTHHSMSSLLSSARNLGPDSSDPNHHTMGELASSVRSLGPDSSDPTHHTMGQLFSSDPLK